MGLVILAFFAASLGDLFGDDTYAGSLKTSHLFAFGVGGLVTFGVGLSRQFKEKQRRKY